MGMGGGSKGINLSNPQGSDWVPIATGAAGDPMAHLMKGAWDEGVEGNTVSQKSHMSQRTGVDLKSMSEFERLLYGDMTSGYDQLKGMLSVDPNSREQQAATKEYENFVEMMSGINKTGGMPTAEDMQRAGQFADAIFAPQREALNQSFEFAQQDAAKLAARLNRPINDPIIQAKLQQERMRQTNMLSADRNAFVAQEARSQPFQRLGMQEQLFNAKTGLADLKAGIASQAMANRMQLLNLGNSLQQQERNWRFQTSDKVGTQSSNSSQHSGGGILGGIGAVTGAAGSIFGMVGSGAQAAGSVMSFGGTGMASGALGGLGGGGGGGPTVQQAQAAPAMAPAPQAAWQQQGGYGQQAAPYYIANPAAVPSRRNSRLFNPSAGGSAYWNMWGK
jgi:hypothetical protein